MNEVEIKKDSISWTETSEQGAVKRNIAVKWENLFMIQKIGVSGASHISIDLAFSEKVKHKASGTVNNRSFKKEADEISFKIAIPTKEYFNVREAFYN